jgi:hypothetical protein
MLHHVSAYLHIIYLKSWIISVVHLNVSSKLGLRVDCVSTPPQQANEKNKLNFFLIYKPVPAQPARGPHHTPHSSMFTSRINLNEHSIGFIKLHPLQILLMQRINKTSQFFNALSNHNKVERSNHFVRTSGF